MRAAPLTIGVIGGGFTGAASAIGCLTRLPEPFRLVLIEPSPALGRGVAYGSHHPLHLLNVRTRDLSIRVGQPGDFLNWAFRQLDQGENHAGLHDALAHTFLPRQLFGEYVRQRLFETVEQRPDVEFSVVPRAARALRVERGRYAISCDGDETVLCDAVVLATAYGVQPASAGGALAPFDALPAERVARAKSIVLVGSGLTMVDVLLGARRDGFQGVATIVSRRGQLPRAHAPKGVVPLPIALPRSKRVSMLEASLRIACEMAEEGGAPWQAVINGLRPSLQDIWQALPVAEQARFLRHLRPVFDAHRHRLPIEVHARLMAELDRGRAVLVRGSASGVERNGDGFKLEILRRGALRSGDGRGRSRIRLLGLQARSRPASDQGPDRYRARAPRRPRIGARGRAERPGARAGRGAEPRPVRRRTALPGDALGDHGGAGDRAPGRCGGDEPRRASGARAQERHLRVLSGRGPSLQAALNFHYG